MREAGRNVPWPQSRFGPWIALLWAFFSAGQAVAGQADIRLFVYQFEFPPGVDAQRRAIYSSLLNEALDARDELTVLGRDDLQVLVKGDVDLGKLVGCADEDCEMAFDDIGRVRLFLAAKLALAPEGELLSLRVFDRRDRAVVFRESFSLGDDLEANRQILAAAAQQIVVQVTRLPGHERLLAIESQSATLTTSGWVGVIGAASGGLCLVVGSIVGGVAASTAAEVEYLANGTYLTQVRAAEARDLGWLANGLWIAGAALAAIGTVLILIGREPAAEVDVVGGPDGVGAVVRF